MTTVNRVDILPTCADQLLGWPKRETCRECGGELVLLLSAYDTADYECRGKVKDREPGSAYSLPRCGKCFTAERLPETLHKRLMQKAPATRARVWSNAQTMYEQAVKDGTPRTADQCLEYALHRARGESGHA